SGGSDPLHSGASCWTSSNLSLGRFRTFEQRSQRHAHLLDRAKNRVLGGVRLQVERGADLFDRVPVIVAHEKRRTLLLAQSVERTLPALTDLAAVDQIAHAWPAAMTGDPFQRFGLFSGFTMRSGSHVVDRAVESDSIQPRREIGPFFEPVELPIRTHERFLHD